MNGRKEEKDTLLSNRLKRWIQCKFMACFCSCSSLMVSSSNADAAREFLEKVADLLLVFAQAGTLVKSYMCSQSLLAWVFQMFNKMELPILLKVCWNFFNSL